MAVVKFKSATLADRVASNLRGVVVDKDYLTFLAFDKAAFELSVSLENLTRTDYSFVNSLEIKFFTDNLFDFFVLVVESTCRTDYPSSIAPASFTIISVRFAIKINTQFFRFLSFVKPILGNDITWIETVAIEMTIRSTKDDAAVVPEYLLALFGDDKRELITFSPYQFSSRAYN